MKNVCGRFYLIYYTMQLNLPNREELLLKLLVSSQIKFVLKLSTLELVLPAIALKQFFNLLNKLETNKVGFEELVWVYQLANN